MGKKALAKCQNPYRAWSPRAQSSDKLNYAKVQKFRFQRLEKIVCEKKFCLLEEFRSKQEESFFLAKTLIKIDIKTFSDIRRRSWKSKKTNSAEKNAPGKAFNSRGKQDQNLAIWQFGTLLFGSLTNWPLGNLAPWQFGPLAIWPLGNFAPLANRHLGNYAPWQFCPLGNLAPWQFGTLALWYLGNWVH